MEEGHFCPQLFQAIFHIETSVTLVGAEIEVELCRVGDADVHRGARWNVAALAALLLLVGTEEPRVVTLLDHDESNTWLVVGLELKC